MVPNEGPQTDSLAFESHCSVDRTPAKAELVRTCVRQPQSEAGHARLGVPDWPSGEEFPCTAGQPSE
jgi:hypothetical protein